MAWVVRECPAGESDGVSREREREGECDLLLESEAKRRFLRGES